MSKFKVLVGDSGRSFFEHDATVHSDLQVVEKIAEAYKEAIKSAANSARLAVRCGRMDDMAEAQWDEAVCQTLEQVLCLFDITDCASDGHWSGKSFNHPIPPKHNS